MEREGKEESHWKQGIEHGQIHFGFFFFFNYDEIWKKTKCINSLLLFLQKCRTLFMNKIIYEVGSKTKGLR